MNEPVFVFSILVILSVILSFYRRYKMKRILQQLFDYTEKKDDAGFQELINASSTRVILNKPSIIISKINHYFVLEQADPLIEMIPQVQKIWLGKQLKASLYYAMFNTFVAKGNIDAAETVAAELTKILEKSKDPDAVKIKEDIQNILKLHQSDN